MTLLAEEMDQHVLSLVDLVEFRRDIPQFPFRADLVEKDRHQLGELFGQVIDRFNRVIEQFGDIPLEQIGVLDAGAGQLQVDDQGGEQGGTPFGLPHDQVQPDPDIAQMGGIGQGLPVLVDPDDIGMLKAETHHPPEKGLDHPAVAAIKDLAAEDLDALQGGMRDICGHWP